ncbi:MAG: hypothetical protein LQ347_003777 [Umbilicaria vellea]|nr:MAG: hypothetical protein LQ347_003777 [Umbilicaria vellea]
MSFPFLRLPPEIRNKVYRLLLVTKHKCQHIFPDVNGTARRLGLRWAFLPDMGDSLSLLVTSKMINQETSTVLYGNNRYLFDDRPYTSGDTGVPACDFTYLYSWLCSIGAENRKKLRCIHLRFRSMEFCYCQGEAVINCGFEIPYPGAQYLIKAFELLAKGHGLSHLRLEFNSMVEQIPDEMLYAQLFRLPRRSQLITHIMKIRGLRELQSVVGKVVRETNGCSKGDAVFRHVKKRMEARQTVKQATSSLPAEISQPQTLGGRINALEEKCAALKQIALRTNQQWKKEVRQIMEMENTLSKIQAAVSEYL